MNFGFNEFVLLVIYLFSFYLLYKYGKDVVGSKKYYNNKKGTLKGKFIFSVLLLGIFLFFVLFTDIYSGVFVFILGLCLIAFFELLNLQFRYTDDKKIASFNMIIDNSTFYLFYLYLCIIIGLFVGISTVDIKLIIFGVFFAIYTDLFCNYIGNKLSKLPDEIIFLRLKYPDWISSNKSFMAVILSVMFMDMMLLNFRVQIEMIQLINLAIIGAVFGDALFSYLKRLAKIDDFFPTLGPIGGVLDRIDGWIFAVIFTSFHPNFMNLILS